MTKTNRLPMKNNKAISMLLIVLGLVTYSEGNAQFAQGLEFASIQYEELTTAGDASVSIEAVKAVRLNKSINSAFEDVKPRLAPCGKRLYFSRVGHPNNTTGETDLEDIWYSNFDSVGQTWSEPVHLEGVLNNDGPNYVNNISTTGDTLLLGNRYLKNGKMRAGLSYSIKVNGSWSVPTNIEIEKYYNLSDHGNAFICLKKGVIISSIQTVDNIGERDLMVSFWDGKKATEPMSMGSMINSEFDESSPFLAQDNETLYFASTGHNGLGGFDIYMSKRLDDTWTNWSTPVNLGPTVNSDMDDEFFSITNCGKFGVFSRRVTVHNTDIYQISLDKIKSGGKRGGPRRQAIASL